MNIPPPAMRRREDVEEEDGELRANSRIALGAQTVRRSRRGDESYFVYSKGADYIHVSGGYLASGNGEGMCGSYGDLNEIRKYGQAK